MTIGDRIKQRRLELGMSQEELGKRLGWKSKSSVCKLETVENNLTLDRVKAVADALNTTSAFLMGWETQGEHYYTNKETEEKAQELLDDPNMRLLFDAAKNSKPEDLQMAADLLKRLKATNPEG